MPDIPVIDTHVHLWDTTRFTYPWLDSLPQLARPFLLPDYDAASAGTQVEAMVFMQCDTAAAEALEEARWVEGLTQDEPRLKGIIPYAPLEQGEGCRGHLEELTTLAHVKGVRRLIQSEPDLAFCLQPDFVTGVRMLADHDLSFDICIAHTQLANATRLVAQCPDVRFILDHTAKPDIKQTIVEPWATELKALAKLPNVTCKLSGMVTEADHESWTRQDLKPYIDQVIACFGFDRVVYGGDWPVVNLAGSYGRWVEALDWALTGCSADELRKLFQDNALRAYRLAPEA